MFVSQVGDVHGKRKLEAIKLKIGTPLCKVTSGDGSVYTILSPIKGKLCELNDNLIKDLTLLNGKPGSNGYLAIVLHQTCTDDDFLDHLLTQEQYTRGECITGRCDVVGGGRGRVEGVGRMNNGGQGVVEAAHKRGASKSPERVGHPPNKKTREGEVLQVVS